MRKLSSLFGALFVCACYDLICGCEFRVIISIFWLVSLRTHPYIHNYICIGLAKTVDILFCGC